METDRNNDDFSLLLVLAAYRQADTNNRGDNNTAAMLRLAIPSGDRFTGRL